MALSDKTLSDNMLIMIRLNMMKISPKAVPQEFQEDMTKAISQATITAMKTLAVTSGGGNVVIGTGSGLTVKDSIMTETAVNMMLGFTGGSSGAAMRPFMEAIMESIKQHLSLAVITSVSGFGGQGGPPVGVTPAVLEQLIMSFLPSNVVTGMTSSPQGLFFVKSIAEGISIGISTGIPGFVPMGSVPPSPGALIGKFS